MNASRKLARFFAGFVGCFVCTLAAGLSPLANAADVHFDMLHIKTETFTNATVIGKSKTDIFVSHAQGLSNVKITDLDARTLQLLGLGSKPQDASPANSGVSTKPVVVHAKEASPGPTTQTSTPIKLSAHRLPSLELISSGLLTGIAFGLVAGYLFFCYCLKLIVQKTGDEPGFMVWLPILQLLPMFRAAGMSGWWLLGCLIPGVSLLAHLLWSVKIVRVREKSIWLAVLLVLPVTNIFAFIYLAFSSVNDDEKAKKVERPKVAPARPVLPQTPSSQTAG